jgi:multisubunit Na+/H+ antiporter MnhF subunit
VHLAFGAALMLALLGFVGSLWLWRMVSQPSSKSSSSES